MKQPFLYTIGLFFLSLSFTNCAKKGRPTGGKIDSIAPVVLKTNPENFSTHFKEKELSIFFDEYIKLKNAQRQIVFSPPLKYAPIIKPYSTSKIIKITFLDTLIENTTYAINFGKSIVDNNEQNEFNYYKYVFSTGDYIDSLNLKGHVKDALLKDPDEQISVMLYEVGEDYNDSIVFKEKPRYIAISNDSLASFELSNLKAGKYRLLALKDNNENYTFEPKTDKIGFIDQFITLPTTDSTFVIKLFKEVPNYKMSSPKHVGKQNILFGYEGKGDAITIELLTQTPENFRSRIIKDIKKDTLNYWYSPNIEADSLKFKVLNNTQVDTFIVRLKRVKQDSLRIEKLSKNRLNFHESFTLKANTPMLRIDTSKVSILNQDSLRVTYKPILDSVYNTLVFDFEKKESQTYTIQLLPEAITDFFGFTNDTLNYRATTGAYSDYGSISLSINNIKSFPVIVQLVNEKGDMYSEIVATENKSFNFENIVQGNYYVRLIYDVNANSIWDTGNFLKQRQPEEVVYFPKLLEARPNWSLVEVFNIN